MIVPTVGIDPAQKRLERDLQSAPVLLGIDAGMWRVDRLTWPYLFVSIAAGDGHFLSMRLLVDGYPAQAPAGEPWDLSGTGPLPTSLWPTGGTAPQIFRSADWSVQNGNAPYMACDRRGLAAHGNWAQEHPNRAWNASRTIEFYLREVHHELRGASIPQSANTS